MAVIVTTVIIASSVGSTQSERDQAQGMMIDFGYWDVDWIEMTFEEGSNGYDVLRSACRIAGYEVLFKSDGGVYSVNGQSNLEGISWAMYALDPSGAWTETDPNGMVSPDHRILCFARASGPDTVVPGTDCTGFEYYSYAKEGVSVKTGENLRIVSLAPSVTETLCAVGGLDHIIGTDLYSNYPHEVTERQNDGTIAITGGYTDPNYEYIVRLAPDIVFCEGGTGEHLSMADKLRKSGIDCVVLYDGSDIETLYANIWIAASALGSSDSANDTIRELRHSIDVSSGIAGMTNKRVFAALSPDPSPWTAGSNTFMTDIIASSGGRNIFESQSSSWFMVSKEQIYAKQPQVIIVISATEVTSEEQYRDILDRLDPLWKQTPAYAEGQVFVFSGDAGDILQRPGPRLSEAVELICKILNPEAFLQRDPMDLVPMYFGDDYQQYLRYQPEA